MKYTITVAAVDAGPDDHGDDVETATDISLGETIQGLMDYEFDLDYFRFTANRGQEYLLQVDHQTLDRSRVEVYRGDGITEPSAHSSSSSEYGTNYR